MSPRLVVVGFEGHPGGFGGAKAYFKSAASSGAAGVMIGYPGLDELVVGGRGVLRVLVHVHGRAGHSGSSRDTSRSDNAVVRAARLIQILSASGVTTAFRCPTS